VLSLSTRIGDRIQESEFRTYLPVPDRLFDRCAVLFGAEASTSTKPVVLMAYFDRCHSRKRNLQEVANGPTLLQTLLETFLHEAIRFVKATACFSFHSLHCSNLHLCSTTAHLAPPTYWSWSWSKLDNRNCH
jgi:hypothetical protein